MGKYLKLFETHQEYEAYLGGGEMILPNVSHCIDVNDVHYNPLVDETKIVAKFNISDDSSPTTIYFYNNSYDPRLGIPITHGVDKFDSVEVDGLEISLEDIDNAEGKYNLSIGNHTVKYALKNPSIIHDYAFYEMNMVSLFLPNGITDIRLCAFAWCENLNNITLPNTLTYIGEESFARTYNLTEFTIPESVTSIDIEVFADSNIERIICKGMTAPTIENTTFDDIKPNGTLIVPSGSSGYDVWMDTLGSYDWTKVEQ